MPRKQKNVEDVPAFIAKLEKKEKQKRAREDREEEKEDDLKELVFWKALMVPHARVWSWIPYNAAAAPVDHKSRKSKPASQERLDMMGDKEARREGRKWLVLEPTDSSCQIIYASSASSAAKKILRQLERVKTGNVYQISLVEKLAGINLYGDKIFNFEAYYAKNENPSEFAQQYGMMWSAKVVAKAPKKLGSNFDINSIASNCSNSEWESDDASEMKEEETIRKEKTKLWERRIAKGYKDDDDEEKENSIVSSDDDLDSDYE